MATTSSAWPAWLRRSLQRSQTSSCPTWGPGGSNPVLCPLPTPPAPHLLSTPSSPGGWAGSNGWGCGCCQICCCLLPLLLLPLPVFHGKAEFASRSFTLHRWGCSAAAVEAARSVWPRTGGASTLLRWCIFAEVLAGQPPPSSRSWKQKQSVCSVFFFPSLLSLNRISWCLQNGRVWISRRKPQGGNLSYSCFQLGLGSAGPTATPVTMLFLYQHTCI